MLFLLLYRQITDNASAYCKLRSQCNNLLKAEAFDPLVFTQVPMGIMWISLCPHPACRGGGAVRNQSFHGLLLAPTPLAGVERRLLHRSRLNGSTSHRASGTRARLKNGRVPASRTRKRALVPSIENQENAPRSRQACLLRTALHPGKRGGGRGAGALSILVANRAPPRQAGWGRKLPILC